ncbi:MAG: GNAT family N-acetyltransferase [Actinobacteria bacterium]|nr:GNAT family N-acetyltransferase [Actinomycetota bacterium]
MIGIPPDEITLVDTAGPVAHYRLGTRDGSPIADDVVVADGRGPQEAAAALLGAPPAPMAATGNPDLAEALMHAGASENRHFFVMRCDVRGPGQMTGIDPRFRLAPLPETDDPAQWRGILPGWRAAFPPEHPDHFPGDDAEAITFHLTLMDGTTMGPLHRASTLLVDQSGTAIGGIMVNVRLEESRWGGPWIADIWRDPSLRGTGIGRMLVSHARTLLAEDSFPGLMLAVTAGNDARRSYEAMGFEVVHESWILDLAPPWAGDGFVTQGG